jgi:hypothetical protein
VTLTANTKAGDFVVGVSVQGTSGPVAAFHMTSKADVSASIEITNDNQTAIADTDYANPLVATVRDVYGNPVAGVTVTFDLPTSGAGGTLTNITDVTDSMGKVSEVLTANDEIGSFAIGVSTNDGYQPSNTFHMTNAASGPASVSLTGDGQSATVTHAYGTMLIVQVLDASRHPVANQTVTFTWPISGAGGTMSATTGITNADGKVSVGFTANTIAGSVTIGVAVAGGTNPTGAFHLTNTADVPASVSVSGSNQRATVGTSFATPLVATVLDRYSNPVSGKTVTFTLPTTGATGSFADGATGITDANGKVTKYLTAGAKSGTFSVRVAVTGGSNPGNTITGLTNVAGAAYSMSLAFSTATTIYAGNLLPTITVQLLDQLGNKTVPAAGTFVPVTISLSAGKFRSGKTLTGKIGSTGVLTITNQYIDLAGTYTMNVSSPGLLALNKVTFTVKAKTVNRTQGVN